MYIHTHIYIYIHIDTYTHIAYMLMYRHIYIHMYMYTCVFMAYLCGGGHADALLACTCKTDEYVCMPLCCLSI